MNDFDTYRSAHMLLDTRPDGDAAVQEWLEALTGHPEGTAAWHRIAAVMSVLRADTPAAAQRVQ